MLTTWVYFFGLATLTTVIPLANCLSMPSQPRALLPRELPSHQLHVPASSQRIPPAHVFAVNLRLEASRSASAVSSFDPATPTASIAVAAPTSTEHFCTWRVSCAGALVATLEVSCDGNLRTSVTDSTALLEEVSLLEARAQCYFGVPEGSVLGLEPLVVVTALAAQRYRQQKHASIEQQWQSKHALELVPCDALSEELLAKAQRAGWCDLTDAVAAQTRAAEAGETPVGDEVVDLVDEAGTVVGMLPRKAVHLYNCLHRGVGILVERPSDGAIFVHQRSHTKRIFPAMYDMFVGGVSAANEPPLLTAQRELAEELGIATHFQETSTPASSSPPPPLPPPSSSSSTSSSSSSSSPAHVAPPSSPLAFMFDATVSTQLNRCRVAVFRCMCDLPGPSDTAPVHIAAASEAADNSVEDESAALNRRSEVDTPHGSSSSRATIQFQASEVQSGQWEPRAVVEADARASWAMHVLGDSSLDSSSFGDRSSSNSSSSSATGGSGVVRVVHEGDEIFQPREFVPDGLTVWHAFLEWETRHIETTA